MAEERREEVRGGVRREGTAGESEGAGTGLARTLVVGELLGGMERNAYSPLFGPRAAILPPCGSSFAWMTEEEEDEDGESVPSLSSASLSFFHLEQWPGAGRGSGVVGEWVALARLSYERSPRTSMWHSRVSPTRGYVRSASSATAGLGREGVEGRLDPREGRAAGQGSSRQEGATAATSEGTFGGGSLSGVRTGSRMLLGLDTVILLDGLFGTPPGTTMSTGDKLPDVSWTGLFAWVQAKTPRRVGLLLGLGPAIPERSADFPKGLGDMFTEVFSGELTGPLSVLGLLEIFMHVAAMLLTAY